MPPVAAVGTFIAANAAAISAGAAIIGAGIAAYGALSSGAAQSRSLKAQAEAARYNQTVAQANAEAARQAGAFKEEQLREKNQRLLATQKTAYGASGVVSSEGTPLDVMASTAADMEQEALAVRYNAAIESSRWRAQAGQYGMEAGRDISMSDYPVTAGYVGAGATLLTGVAKAMEPYAFPYKKE